MAEHWRLLQRVSSPACCHFGATRMLSLRFNSAEPGLKATFESIDNRSDFKIYMQNYAYAHTGPKGPRREGPPEEGFVRYPYL